MVNNPSYSTVLFDWDGTLARSIPVWEDAFRTVFETLHMPINIDATTEKLWIDSQVLNELGIEHDGFFDLVYEQLSREYPKTPLYEGVKEILYELREKSFKMALVTSTRRKYVKQALQYHDIEHYFESVVACEDVQLHKPNPEPYEHALALLAQSKDSSLIVGDSKFDLIGSKNAGIDCTLFFSGREQKILQGRRAESAGT